MVYLSMFIISVVWNLRINSKHYIICMSDLLHLYACMFDIVTPHAQRERGKVIGRGVHIYIYIYMSVVEKKI